MYILSLRFVKKSSEKNMTKTNWKNIGTQIINALFCLLFILKHKPLKLLKLVYRNLLVETFSIF